MDKQQEQESRPVEKKVVLVDLEAIKKEHLLKKAELLKRGIILEDK